jgi:hypothetical protein
MSNWAALKDMKHSYPIQVVEYAIANHIDDEPVFMWWVHQVIKRKDGMIFKVKS